MPRIPTIDQQTSPFTAFRLGTLQLPTPTAESQSGPGFQAVTAAGNQLGLLEAKLRAQQDEADALRLSSLMEDRLATVRAELLKDPDTQGRSKKFLTAAKTVMETVWQDKGAESETVKQALAAHAQRIVPRQLIDVRVEAAAQQAENLTVTWERENEQVSDWAAGQAAVGDTARAEAALAQRERELGVKVQEGLFSPKQAVAEQQKLYKRYYSGLAEQNPDAILQMETTGKIPATMDRADLPYYRNLAIARLSTMNYEQDRALKREDAAVKRIQEQTYSDVSAKVLARDPTALNPLSELVRTRQLDADKVAPLRALQASLAAPAAHGPNYDRTMAPELERDLRQAKYQSGSADEKLDKISADITEGFIQGVIDQDEFRRLMPLVSSVRAERAQGGKEDHNQAVTRAHGNLMHFLKTTGIQDKYDALSAEAMDAAETYYYAQLEQPNAKPWEVAKQAKDIFGPVVKERKLISESDAARLDDARMEALRKSGGISEAGYQAWQQRRETEKGWQIVDQTLQGLPPPPPPSLLERLNPFKKSEEKPKETKPRKKPGMMGQ